MRRGTLVEKHCPGGPVVLKMTNFFILNSGFKIFGGTSPKKIEAKFDLTALFCILSFTAKRRKP